MKAKLLLAVIAIAIMVAAGSLFHRSASRSVPVPTATLPADRNFTLTGSKGPVSLGDFPGKLVLLYFGYTYCPDICPTNLSMWAQALTQLKPDELARVQPIFISVDPERDTVERLASYGPFFHPTLISLTGKPETLAGIARRYGVVYSRYDDPATGTYAIDHTAVTYVLDAQGQVAAKLPHGAPPDDLVSAIRRYLPPRS